MKTFKIILISIISLSIGLAGGVYLAKKRVGSNVAKKEALRPKGKTGGKILFYRNPMNPSITSPVPAKDAMGMDYVPVYEGGENSGESPGTVKIDPVVEQNIGVRTGKARIMEMSKVIRTYGRISYNEDKIYSVHPRSKGWLDRVYVSRTGDLIRKGQVLATIYSPELVSTQHEYLLAVQGRRHLGEVDIELIKMDAEALVRSARKRLRLFGVSEAEISKLETTGKASTSIEMRSSISGTVVKVAAREGGFVTPLSELYRVSDLSSVWVMADVYESDFPWIRKGDEALVSFPAKRGKPLKGTVRFIYPYEKAKKRTVQVRMVFENRKGLLKPDMFVNVSIMASPRKALAVPSEAIIRSGTREISFVKKGPGRYEPRQIETGIESGGYTAVINGLSPGEEVVTSAQFLIDSESKLREATLKMISPKKEKGGMKMKRESSDDKGNN